MRKSDYIACGLLTVVVLLALVIASISLDDELELPSDDLRLLSVSMVYGLPWIVCYPLAWMFFRGTNNLGQINFKNNQEALVFIVTAFLGFLVILHLTSIGVLPS